MATSKYVFVGNRMYDTEDRLIATRDSSGRYIDKRGNVRALANTVYSSPSEQNLAYENYGREASQLSSSAPGRRAPSHIQERSTSGSVHYPDGIPLNRAGIRPQSATGYAATPTSPRGEGYEQCLTPYRVGSPIDTQYKGYKQGDKDYAASKLCYASELAKAAEASDTTALIGGNLSGLQLDQEGHRTVMPIAAKANNDGLGAATKRLAHSSDHYGRLPRSGHRDHLTAAANLAGFAGRGTPAQRDRYHTHYSQDTPKHDSDDETPLSELTASERRKREKRQDIEWAQKKQSWEISEREWQQINSLRRETQSRDRDHYDSGKGMSRGPALGNGKYEWIAVGGGRRRFWSDSHDDYVERREPVDRSYRR